MGATIWNHPPPAREPESRHFKAPEVAEWEGVQLVLRPPDGVVATKAALLKAELVVKHIRGLRGPDGELVKKPDDSPVQPPVSVKCQDGERRTPDELAIDRYSKMVAMWADPVNLAPGLGEVIGWQVVLFDTWFEIANWIEDIYQKRAAVKGGSTAPSSAASSDATPSTLKSPPEETPSCAASNGHSGDSLGSEEGNPNPLGSIPSATAG